MLDKPNTTDHSDMMVEYRARQGVHRQTYITWREIEISGARGFGGTILVEVEFYRSAEAVKQTWDDPGAPAEYEISAVRPFERRVLSTGFIGTQRHYLPAPVWLQELLMEAIDTDSLWADADD